VFKWGIVKFGQGITLVVAAFLLLWMLVAVGQLPSSYPYPWWQFVLGLLLLIIIVGLIILASRFLAHRRTIWLHGTFLGLTLLKWPLIWLIRIVPTSDFWNYHALGSFSAQGVSWQAMAQRGDLGAYLLFPHAINIANFWGLGMSFFGTNFVVSQIINVLMTWLDMWLLVMIVSRWLPRWVAISSALIFAAIPAYWLYSTLLNGAEPLFLTAVLVSISAFFKAIKPSDTMTKADVWFQLGIAWVGLVVANMIRPIMSVLIIALIILGIELALQPVQSIIVKQTKFWEFIVVGVVLITAVPMTYNWLYGVNFAPNAVTVAYGTATGTDFKTNGAYNDKRLSSVSKTLEKASNETVAYKKLQTELHQQTQQNVQSLTQKQAWPAFFYLKMRNLMAEDYGYDWVLYNLQHNQPINRWFYQIGGVLTVLSTGYLLGLLACALVSVVLGLVMLTKNSRLNNYFSYSALLFDGFALSSLLFEVQGRYHVILYLPLILLITCGLAAKSGKSPQKND